jgi:polysaccharide export outer membrane protein
MGGALLNRALARDRASTLQFRRTLGPSRLSTACWTALLAAPLVLGAQLSDYEIGPADVLQVIVLGQPTLSGEFAVEPDGMLRFPFLDRLRVSGMSSPEVERKLTTLLSDGYLKRPQVSVSVKLYRSQRIYVTGEVMKPGRYGLHPDRSLLTLLQEVGELAPNVGHEVFVTRPPTDRAPLSAEATGAANGGNRQAGNDGPNAGGDKSTAVPSGAGEALPGEVPGAQVFRLNLRELRSGDPDKDFKLQVGDTVYFPRAAQVYVTGHAARPGSYRYEEGLTVFQLLALAGNPTERGSSKVKLIRLVDGKRKEFRPKLTDPVLAEDTLHVPERFF